MASGAVGKIKHGAATPKGAPKAPSIPAASSKMCGGKKK